MTLPRSSRLIDNKMIKLSTLLLTVVMLSACISNNIYDCPDDPRRTYTLEYEEYLHLKEIEETTNIDVEYLAKERTAVLSELCQNREYFCWEHNYSPLRYEHYLYLIPKCTVAE